MPGIIQLLLGITCIIGGIAIVGFRYYLSYRLRKYEFENRTDGGVIQFKSFRAATGHGLSKRFVNLVSVLGALIFGLGGYLTVRATHPATTSDQSQPVAHALKHKSHKATN